MEDVVEDDFRKYEILDKMEEDYLKMQCEKLKFRKHIKNVKSIRDLTDEQEIFDLEQDPATPKDYAKKYRFEKLKTSGSDGSQYYYDNVLNYIWKTKRVLETGEEILVKPNDREYSNIKRVNSISSEPYIAQPEIFWE